jgi:hypothetical protein
MNDEVQFEIAQYDQSLVSDYDIQQAFLGTNFGTPFHRKLLEQGVLKIQAGYRTGHTLRTIMIELGLLTPRDYVTKKGRKFMFSAFLDRAHSG